MSTLVDFWNLKTKSFTIKVWNKLYNMTANIVTVWKQHQNHHVTYVYIFLSVFIYIQIALSNPVALYGHVNPQRTKKSMNTDKWRIVQAVSTVASQHPTLCSNPPTPPYLWSLHVFSVSVCQQTSRLGEAPTSCRCWVWLSVYTNLSAV